MALNTSHPVTKQNISPQTRKSRATNCVSSEDHLPHLFDKEMSVRWKPQVLGSKSGTLPLNKKDHTLYNFSFIVISII